MSKKTKSQKSKYGPDDIKNWAEYYRVKPSFRKVADHFNVNIKTVTKRLKEFKDDFGLIFPHEERALLKSQDLKRCYKCDSVKSLAEFELYDDGTKYRGSCKICRHTEKAEYVARNKEKVDEYHRQYRADNIEQIKSRRKVKYQGDKEALGVRRRELYVKNHAHIRKRIAARHAERMRTEPEYVLRRAVRARTGAAVKSIGEKSAGSLEYLGCSISELKTHLESQFKPGMSWDNYGYYGWHIDHIKPISSFNLTIETELAQACHYTNLQPLWAKENFSKGNRIGPEFGNADETM